MEDGPAPATTSSSLEKGKREITADTVTQVTRLMKGNVIETIGSRAEENGTSSVSLRCSNFNAAHAEDLSLMLHKCTSLTRIDLSETDIGAEGFRNIIRGVGHFSKSVKQLSFRGCNLGAEAAQVLIPTDSHNKLFALPTVEELDLSHNDFSDAFAFKLAAALPSNSSLAILDLRENKFSESAQKALAEAAASHPTLKALPTETTWKDTRNVCARSCDQKDCVIM